MRGVRILTLVMAILVWIAAGAAAAEPETVRAWEGTITIPSYPLYGGDVNPKFYELDGSILYPYNMQDHLSTEKEDREYRAVYLENEYLKITCLPQIGGRIHSVLDKTTNEQMFHLNNVIKPGLIALRGAWVSGGIEWNRGPQGHTVTSFTPVNVITQPRPDGSASLVIGYTEHNFKTRWNVRLTLHPRKAYLDEEIRIYNPTDGVHSYYFWNNTAFPCRKGTRFIYPMTLGTDHGGTNFFSWPVHDGRDLTWLKNYDAPTSVFAYHCAFDFFGAYDVDADRGIVQYGDHHILTGKKAWTWGQSGDGLASQAALTDEDGPYIEVQSGPLATQADYGLLGPHQEVAWQEWWYPVHGLGDGFEYATRDAAVQAYRSGEGGQTSLEVRVLATGVFPGATCRITRGDMNLLEQRADLSPEQPLVLTVPQAGAAPVDIAVRDAEGATLAAYTSPLPIPLRTPPAKTESASAEPLTAEEAWLEGRTFEERIRRTQARKSYERALTFDPNYAPALRSLAVLDVEAGLYDAAAERLRQTLDRNPKDGLSWYYLGVSQLNQDHLEDAVESGYRTVALLDHAALGYDLVGRAHMRARRYKEAADAFARAVEISPRDSRALDHWLTALYADGQQDILLAKIPEAYAQDPLDWVLRALVAMQHDDYIREFIADLKQYAGPYPSEVISLSLYFDDLGLTREALRFLSLAFETTVPASHQVLYRAPKVDLRNRAMPWYVLAYLAAKVGEDEMAARYLRRTKTTLPYYSFPSKPPYIAIMKNAIEMDPQDGNAHAILGNLYAGLGRLPEAVDAWEHAVQLPGVPSVAFRNIGYYAWKSSGDLDKAADYYRQAIDAFAGDQTLYRDLANILIALKKPDEAIALLEGMPLHVPRRGDVTVLLAGTYNDVGRYDDALALLDESTFSNWENNNQTWRLWSRAHLERGKHHLEAGDAASALEDFQAALTYPENLGVGRPAHPEEAEALFWQGKALAALGKTDEAHAAWTQGATLPEGSANQKDFAKRCEEALKEAS